MLEESLIYARLDALSIVLGELHDALPVDAEAAEGWGLPGSYREVLEKLGEHGVLPRDFALELAPMAGFRTILQHEYVALDIVELDRNARRLDDFNCFAECVVRYLDG